MKCWSSIDQYDHINILLQMLQIIQETITIQRNWIMRSYLDIQHVHSISYDILSNKSQIIIHLKILQIRIWYRTTIQYHKSSQAAKHIAIYL